MAPELLRVKLTAEVDEHPMLDHLGEYRDEPGPDGRTIDRRKHGDWEPGEKRYFVARYASIALEDYERMEQFSNGLLSQHIIRAVAAVDARGWRQELVSPGIGGVPSDSPNRAAKASEEELRSLRGILDAYNVVFEPPLTAEWDDDAPFDGTVTLADDQ